MHVAHLTIPFEYACGVSRHVLILAREQAKRHRVSVITPTGSATSLLDREGIQWMAMPIGATQKNPWDAVRALTRLISFVQRQRVDVLHAHHRYPAALARLVSAAVRDVHTVATCHYMAEGNPRFSYPAERVIAVSEATRRHLIDELGIVEERIRVIPNVLAPLDVHFGDHRACPPLPVGGEGATLVGVGRLEEAKGFSTLLEAAARLRERGPAPRVILVGDGPMRGELEALAHARRVELWITGTVPSALPYLVLADVFVHPSHTETFGLAVAEAGLAGCAVVCTNVGGLPELVEHRKTGLIVPPHDSVVLADAIAELLDDEAKRRCLSSAFREVMESRARPEIMAASTHDLYESVIRGE